MRVAIIGAGAAGLVAAWHAARGGAEVTVFERSAHIGGRVRSDRMDGCIVDTGAQLFGSGFSMLFRVAQHLGREDLLVRAPGHDALMRNGKIHGIDYGSISSMVLSGALPTGLKLKLGAKYVPFLLKNSQMLDASDPLAAGADWLDTESVAEWGKRELGQDFVDLLAYPLLGAYYGSAPENTSAAMYHCLAKAGMDVGVYAIKGGTGALTQALADAAQERGARVELNAEITTLPLHFDRVVVATPAPEALALMQEFPEVVSWLQRVEYSPSAVLAVLLKDRIGHEYFGVSLLRGDDVVAICNESRKLGSLAPADRDLLVCLSAPDVSPELIADGNAAVQRMIAALERVVPGIRARISRVKLYRHRYAYPVFYAGYLKHLRAFAHVRMPENIRLAGDYLVAPTLEGALRSGLRAVEDLFSDRG